MSRLPEPGDGGGEPVALGAVDAHFARSRQCGVGQARQRDGVGRRLEAPPVEVVAEFTARADLQAAALDDDFHLVERFGRALGPDGRCPAEMDDDDVGPGGGDLVEAADAIVALAR